MNPELEAKSNIITWHTGKPDKTCHYFINLGDRVELAWYSLNCFNGTWFKLANQSCTFEDFIEEEDIKCWVKAEKIAWLLQEKKCKPDMFAVAYEKVEN